MTETTSHVNRVARAINDNQSSWDVVWRANDAIENRDYALTTVSTLAGDEELLYVEVAAPISAMKSSAEFTIVALTETRVVVVEGTANEMLAVGRVFARRTATELGTKRVPYRSSDLQGQNLEGAEITVVYPAGVVKLPIGEGGISHPLRRLVADLLPSLIDDVTATPRE